MKGQISTATMILAVIVTAIVVGAVILWISESRFQEVKLEKEDLQSQIENLQTQLPPETGTNVKVKQDPGKVFYWVLPGERRLSPSVFGTPDDPHLVLSILWTTWQWLSKPHPQQCRNCFRTCRCWWPHPRKPERRSTTQSPTRS